MGMEDGVEVEREPEGVHPRPDAGTPFNKATATPHTPGEVRKLQLEDAREKDGVEEGEAIAALDGWREEKEGGNMCERA